MEAEDGRMRAEVELEDLKSRKSVVSTLPYLHLPHWESSSYHVVDMAVRRESSVGQLGLPWTVMVFSMCVIVAMIVFKCSRLHYSIHTV